MLVAVGNGEPDGVSGIGGGAGEVEYGRTDGRRNVDSVVVNEAELPAIVRDQARARDPLAPRTARPIDAVLPVLERGELSGNGVGLSGTGRPGKG